jgi:hypothetical protein
MIKVFKFRLCVIIFMTVVNLNLIAQEEDDSGKLPVRSPFEAGSLIDNPTIVSPLKGALELNILHRFGLMDNGTSDLYGIYASSNIKMGLNYGITDRIMVGVGTTKDYKLQDINWKFALIRQNRSGSIPLAVSYYGNMVIDARAKENFGPSERFRNIHRISYFTEIMVARKFSEVVSLQVAPSFIYYNAIDTGFKNICFGLSLGGRVKIFSSSSIIFEYDQSLTKSDAIVAKPNMALGYEIGTATHAFQLFVSNFRDILPQRNYVFNTNDFTKGKFLFGFNITVRL